METFERIRLLRKEYLKLSQEQFGEVLGVSRTVIKNIELGALARPEQKEPLYRLICEKFHVSYKWLVSGDESEGMFVSKKEGDPLDALLKSKDIPAADLEAIKSIIGAFLELKKPSRDAVVEFVRACAKKLNGLPADSSSSDTVSRAEFEEMKRENQELRTRIEAMEKEEEIADRESLLKVRKNGGSS